MWFFDWGAYGSVAFARGFFIQNVVGTKANAPKCEEGGECQKQSELSQDDNRKEDYAEETMQLWEEDESDENVGVEEKVSEVMLGVAQDVCSECEKNVSNPWVLGHEEVI